MSSAPPAGVAATDQTDAISGFRLDAHEFPTDGTFGAFGGSWIPEILVPAAQRIAAAWADARSDPEFLAEYAHACRTFIGRPTPLQDAPRLAATVGDGARILLKREDLAHTGAHKINNAIGQALLARRMGVTRIIAETGAGQHGVATATACALLGIECVVHMGAHDIERQHPNVERMELLGARVHPVEEGTRTLTDAVSSAIREWVGDPDGIYYLIGSAVGMHPFPTIVRDLQCVIGHEARAQCLTLVDALPDAVVACVGGGSNSIGTFVPFLADEAVELHGAEAAGAGVDTPRHAASIVGGSDGVLHGARTMLLQDADGQVRATHSISAGLDYPGVGPQHAALAASGRATYHPVTDDEAMAALELVCRTEGIIPAIESAHAVALALRLAAERSNEDTVLVTLSGRGDKDLATIAAYRAGRT